MSIPVEFRGGIDILPGTETEPVGDGGFRLVTQAGVPYFTPDGIAFTSLAPAVPASSSTAGLMTAAQFVALQNVGEYQLDIDMTGTGDKGTIVPARAGQLFVIQRWSQLVLAITGTASSTAPTASVGVSPSFNGTIAATALQTVGALNAGPGQYNSANVTGSVAAAVSNSALHVSVGTAVTGATVLSVRISVFGYWTAF